MNYHSGEWAKFLTTEAFYTLFTVDDRLVIDHFYCHRGANLLALLATLAGFVLYYGLCFKGASRNLAEKLGLVIKEQTALDGDVFIIVNNEGVNVAADR